MNAKEEMLDTEEIVKAIDESEDIVEAQDQPEDNIEQTQVNQEHSEASNNDNQEVKEVKAEEPKKVENLNKIKQELIYGKITLSDRDIFIDPIKVEAKHEKQYNGDICTITIYDVEDKKLKRIRNEINSNKAKYHTKRAASNTKTTVKGSFKGVFGGIKAFGKEVKNSFKDEMKNIY